MSVNQRIESLRNYYHISQRDFSKSIGIDEATYSKIKKGTLNPGKTILDKIVISYNDVSIPWLLFGQGIMLKSTEDIQHVAETTPNYNYMENESWKSYIMDDVRKLKQQMEELMHRMDAIDCHSKKKNRVG